LKVFLKWTGIIITGLLALAVLGSLSLYGLGQMRLNKVYRVPEQSLSIPEDEASLLEGKRIFQYRGCEACHGEELQGLVYMDNPALGQVITPNLTRGEGGVGADRTDADLLGAIRHGIRPDGTPLLFMPSTEFYYLSDGDLGKILAYMRSKEAVDNSMPPSQLSFTGFIAMNLVQGITFLPAELIPHDESPPTVPEPAVSAEYGAYLSLSCRVCHGITLTGGEIPAFPAEWPAAPNLTSGQGSRLPAWGEAGFIEIIRDGRKHGRMIHSAYMPWKSYRFMTDDELRAVYAYLMSLPPEDFGNR
jgi:mono/diheme cytochrome c family protein